MQLTIDARPVEVPEGATVLDAVNRLGIALPQLCKDPDRAPLGACRTCLVEVEGQRGFPASCHPPRATAWPSARTRPGSCASAGVSSI
jgi:NADH dehydrogenase/NADH:ubiquinone oxidoreductase subunit G